MLLWIAFAVLTAVVLTFLLIPLVRGGRRDHARATYDLNVYRDQLRELERDENTGTIAATEAQAARAEISRRMLAADIRLKEQQAATQGRATWPAFAALAAIPLAAVAAYMAIGHPDYRDVPRADRLANALQTNDLPALVVQVESHLANKPKDAEGWLVLAPAYRRLGRYQDAADAFERAIALSERNPSLYTEYGETLVLANDGTVVAKARQAFEAALKLDSTFAKARFYIGMTQAQDGDKQAAGNTFSQLLKEAPADAPWRALVEQQLAGLDAPAPAPAPGPGREQIAAAAQMTASERQTMIRNMVDGLAERLTEDGQDLDGWLRLINARMVLGEQDKAVLALKSAREHFKQDEAALSRIANAATKLGLN